MVDHIDMDKVINILFKWTKLRQAIFEEVDWHNSIGFTLNDPESMKIGSSFWYDFDGWRGWTQKDNGSYYFNDIPEKSLSDIFELFYERESDKIQ